MISEWTLKRSAPNGQAVLGTLTPGSGAPCATLERLAVQIPEGRYRVALTVSERACFGKLWSPYEDHRLPLLMDVPGRTSIRIHAGNCCTDSEGCILVGGASTATEIHQSRPAVTRLVHELHDADRNGDQVWLTVRSPA